MILLLLNCGLIKLGSNVHQYTLSPDDTTLAGASGRHLLVSCAGHSKDVRRVLCPIRIVILLPVLLIEACDIVKI